MKMKKIMVMLAAALVFAPALTAVAEEAPAAKPKKKLQMKIFTNQFEPAKAAAAKAETPMLVFVLIDDDKSALITKLLYKREIKKFVQENFSTLILKGKTSAKDKKLVDKKSFKNWDFVEKYVMDADHKAVDDTADMVSKYPGAFIVTADCEKKLVDLPKYDPQLGFGAWAMDLVAKMEAAGLSANVSPELKKAMENPQPDIKQPAKKKK